MLTDSIQQKRQHSPPVRARNAPTNVGWSDKQKMEAVTSFIVTGNIALTSRMLGIPEVTIRSWKNSKWWAEVAAEIKAGERLSLAARVKKMVEASMAVVEDRLVNGDYAYNNRTGEMIRKPVAMRDAQKVAMDSMSRVDVLEQSVSEVQKDEDTDSRLLRLAEKFADMAVQKIAQKQDDSRTVDITDIEG